MWIACTGLWDGVKDWSRTNRCSCRGTCAWLQRLRRRRLLKHHLLTPNSCHTTVLDCKWDSLKCSLILGHWLSLDSITHWSVAVLEVGQCYFITMLLRSCIWFGTVFSLHILCPILFLNIYFLKALHFLSGPIMLKNGSGNRASLNKVSSCGEVMPF